MTAVYFVASLFVVGNFVLCFHEDGAVFLELSKVQQNADIAKDSIAENASDCEDSDCSDSTINNFTLNASGGKIFDTDNSKSQLSQWIFSIGLTTEAATHHGWRSDPPKIVGSHYTLILKPTLVFQV